MFGKPRIAVGGGERGGVELGVPVFPREVTHDRSVLAALLLAGSGSVALAQTQPPPLPPPPQDTDTGRTVYQKVLRSTVWVHSERGRGTATGTGSLIDKGRRLVLTNYHVVGEVKRATVYFPVFEAGKAVSEKRYYTERTGRLGIPGEVVELDKGADLALIRVDRLPEGATEIALGASPDPGQTVHSIGNPGRSGALWVYTPGKVRQVYPKKWQAKLDERTILTFEAKIIETDSPTNPGDSGGPLANDKGELIGVTQGGALDAQSLSTFVDITEVKRLMNRRSVQALRAVAASDPPKKDEKKDPQREKALVSKDPAKFFGEEAFKKVTPAAELLFKEKKIDLMVETFATPPKGDAEKVRAMSAMDREKFFREIALERGKAEKVNGVYILVNKNPGFVYVERVGDADLPADLGSRLRNQLITSFKEKKFDEGLTKAVEMVLEAKGLPEKK
jgi:S1-C subfamily serine protease